MNDLSTKRSREKLVPRREPYWQRVEAGRALGFRRGPDTWIARFHGTDGKDHYHALKASHDHASAMRAAREWFEKVDHPAKGLERGDVQRALTDYVAHLAAHGREETARDLLPRFRSLVFGDAIASLPLEELTRPKVEGWLRRIAKGPRGKRSGATVNRYYRMLAAGLTRALELGYAGDREAWKIERVSDGREESGETAVFLSQDQRTALLAASSPAARLFFRALELTGGRPREVAAAVVADFDPVGHTLRLAHRKGKPFTLRPRPVSLSREALALVRAQAQGRPAQALLFPAAAGRPWTRKTWAQAFRAAAAAVQSAGGPALPEDASTYALRHTRISELLQIHHIDPITVAHQCGTSVGIIQKHYFRFIRTAQQEKLGAL